MESIVVSILINIIYIVDYASYHAQPRLTSTRIELSSSKPDRMIVPPAINIEVTFCLISSKVLLCPIKLSVHGCKPVLCCLMPHEPRLGTKYVQFIPKLES